MASDGRRNNVRDLRDIRGLKYPDAYVTRWFFKQALDQCGGRMLELGCGTGNNLALPLAYGWEVMGVDFSAAALADAEHNLGPGPALVEADLSHGLPPQAAGPFDAVMIPNLLCYLRTGEAEATLAALRPRLSRGCNLFLSTRLTDDYRFGRGEEIESHTFRLATPETGEAGLINRFYTEDELTRLATRTLGLTDVVTLGARFDNLQAGQRVTNSDLVLWGRVA
jgi:SAM-dependent methyltransferase